ncbi:anti-sigma factor [Mucilaginibacter robiniae]|nr:anti-sigma factor [Mucilaginibacter robiniae]
MSAEERAEVETMAKAHSAIRAELNEIEQSVMSYADAHSIDPADALRNRVLNSLLTNLGDDRTFTRGKFNQPEARVVPIKPTTSIFYKYAFAACLLLLCISMAALGLVYKRLQQSNQQLYSMQVHEQQFAHQVKLMDDELSVFHDSSYRVVKLKGTPHSPSSSLMVAWNPGKKQVMIDMHHAQMPNIDQKHQYQLWAIASGKPVDLGVFDATPSDSLQMKFMKPILLADAFAVTVEPRGGSTEPTMNQMVAMGTL